MTITNIQLLYERFKERGENMKIHVKDKYMFVNAKPTKNPSYFLYTLADDDLNKFTVVSDKTFGELVPKTMVDVELEVTINNERLMIVGGDQRGNFFDLARFNLISIKQLGNK